MQSTLSGLLLALLSAFPALLTAQEEPPIPLKAGLEPPAGAVAVIDRIPIPRKTFVDGLYRRFRGHITGQQALENLVSQKVIDAQMKARGVAVSASDAEKEFDRLDEQVREQTKNQTDLATEMRKKGMSRDQMLTLLRYKIALEKLSALDFGKEKSSPVEQEQWLKAKRADARIVTDPTKLPDDAAAAVGDDFVTREEFAASLVQLLDRNESVKLIEAHMQAVLADRLCAAENLKIDDDDVDAVYKQVKDRFEADPRYQGVAFAEFIRERFGMDADTHRSSANFRREVCLSRLGEKVVSTADTERLYQENERQFGPLYRLRHIIIRGSDDPQFAGKMRSLAEAKKTADEVWKKLDGGTMTFEEAAPLFSEDARSKFKKGEWDTFTPAQLDKVEGGETIAALAIGTCTPPLLFSGGYRIVKLDEKAPVPPLSPEVAQDLRKNRAFEIFAEAWKRSERGYDLERLLPGGATK